VVTAPLTGDRRASHWIDEVTGLFVGDVAEAYLVGVAGFRSASDCSVIALAVDGLDSFRATRGEPAVTGILARVAGVVRARPTLASLRPPTAAA
jgi:hypothetical protein